MGATKKNEEAFIILKTKSCNARKIDVIILGHILLFLVYIVAVFFYAIFSMRMFWERIYRVQIELGVLAISQVVDNTNLVNLCSHIKHILIGRH